MEDLKTGLKIKGKDIEKWVNTSVEFNRVISKQNGDQKTKILFFVFSAISPISMETTE